MTTFTKSQIDRAKKRYHSFLKIHTVANYSVNEIGQMEAERRCEYHNDIIAKINDGDKSLEKEWKIFFMHEVVMEDQKTEESAAKKRANKEASDDILAPIKDLRKIGEFGKWLNVRGNEFRKQHFNKKYTSDAVNAFLATL